MTLPLLGIESTYTACPANPENPRDFSDSCQLFPSLPRPRRMRNSLMATITPHTHITPFPTASATRTACHSHFLPLPSRAPQSLHIYTHILRPYSTRLTCRFMPPITPSTWKTARTADRFSPVCPQNVPIPPNGPEALLEVPRARLAQLRRLLPLLKNQSEDCLYLNIYVPYETQTARRKSQIA